MLTIKRRHTAVKAITAGSVAFAIGLTGATAFIGDNFQAETPTFNKEQNTTETAQDATPITDTSTDTTGQDSGTDTSGATTQPAASGSMFAPAPSSSTSTGASTSTLQAPSSTSVSGSTAPTSGTAPDTSSGGGTQTDDGGTSITGPILDPIQGAVCTLLCP